MVGKIGRHLQKITNGKMILPRIYALDPAGNKFQMKIKLFSNMELLI